MNFVHAETAVVWRAAGVNENSFGKWAVVASRAGLPGEEPFVHQRSVVFRSG